MAKVADKEVTEAFCGELKADALSGPVEGFEVEIACGCAVVDEVVKLALEGLEGPGAGCCCDSEGDEDDDDEERASRGDEEGRG